MNELSRNEISPRGVVGPVVMGIGKGVLGVGDGERRMSRAWFEGRAVWCCKVLWWLQQCRCSGVGGWITISGTVLSC